MKYYFKAVGVVEATTRVEAWDISQAILSNLNMTVLHINLEPMPIEDAEYWATINKDD